MKDVHPLPFPLRQAERQASRGTGTNEALLWEIRESADVADPTTVADFGFIFSGKLRAKMV